MTDADRTNPDDLDLQALDPDDTEQQLHPSAPLPAGHDDADDDWAEELDYQENDG